MKTCSTCDAVHPVDHYQVRADTGRRRGQCRACLAAKDAKYRSQPHALELEKARYRRYRYGIEPETLHGLFRSQGGMCANTACREPLQLGTRQCHIDHDHKTGQVRGLLCSHCNWMLGDAFDTPARLRGAADYLESHAAVARLGTHPLD